jgi:hypothetical protein
MNSYKKGILTREWLINMSKDIFNEQGLNITLSNLAKELDITLGRLTHHFPTKDQLFIAIAADYEQKVQDYRFGNKEMKISIESLFLYSSGIMDLQYEYRCAQRYVASSSRKQLDLLQHITASYKTRSESILNLTKALVNCGELKPTVLDEPNFRIFMFSFTCLFTSWPVNLEIYDLEESYEKMKPIYLKGIFSTYIPYATPLGEEALRKIGIL